MTSGGRPDEGVAKAVGARLKVVVAAYACEPDKGSEPEVGWRWVHQIARHHEVWVLTRSNNRPAIERAMAVAPVPNIHFEYVDLPRWARFWKRGGRGVHLYYFLWQCLALQRARRLHRQVRFELSHHVTFSPSYQPAMLAFLGVPFVWGPVGGLERIPYPFHAMFTAGQRLRERVRAIAQWSMRLNPLVRWPLRRARAVLAATAVTHDALSMCKRDGVVVEAQVGMIPAADAQSFRTGVPFTVLTAGRHVYWKATILLLRAFARFVADTSAQVRLVVLSNGPERDRLERECERLGITSVVQFVGWLPTQEAVFDCYRTAHVFAYASLLECAGYVVLEALSQGLPVVCLDLPGPGEIVDDSCGIRVHADEPDATVRRLATALSTLYRDPERRLELARGALRRVREGFSWDTKGDRLDRLYRQLLVGKD